MPISHCSLGLVSRVAGRGDEFVADLDQGRDGGLGVDLARTPT